MFTARLTSSEYATANEHPFGSPHRYTHWIVRRTSDDVAVVANMWDAVNLLEYMTPAVLFDGVEYEVQIAHVDTFGYETWSDPVLLGEEALLQPPRRKAWAFELDGHVFYVLNTPDAGTLICDLVTGQWHKWNTLGFPFWNMHRGIVWRSQVLGADATGARIWRLDPASSLDEGTRPIERAVTGFQPLRGSNGVRQGSMRLTARKETGTQAVVTMRFSDDGGRTWSSLREVPLGVAGMKRIEFRSLGRIRAPGRIWEIVDRGGLVRIDGADTDGDGSE